MEPEPTYSRVVNAGCCVALCLVMVFLIAMAISILSDEVFRDDD